MGWNEKEISTKKAALRHTYANFRAEIDNKMVTQNEIRDILVKETSVEIRKKAWEASREIGQTLAPKIIELVKLRNQGARYLGYENYYDMMLDLDDINKNELFNIFDDLKIQTDKSFEKVITQVKKTLSNKFDVSIEEVGCWAFKDSFCHLDPIETSKLNDVFKDKNVLAITKEFYDKMGFDIDDLIANSDLYEKEGKSQHAFCISMDRKKDVRTFNSIKSDIKSMEALLHEFAHGIYFMNIDEKLPWLLRDYPHTISTEAIALLMGGQVYSKEFLSEFLKISDESFFEDVEQSLKRRRLIFSRSVLMINEFESKMYEDPTQDLNNLWWDLFEKYYNISRPENREGKADWAAKYHIGLAPVYFYSYLLGEVMASTLKNNLLELSGDNNILREKTAEFLKDKMFIHGSKYNWMDLIEYMTGNSFSTKAWIDECNQ